MSESGENSNQMVNKSLKITFGRSERKITTLKSVLVLFQRWECFEYKNILSVFFVRLFINDITSLFTIQFYVVVSLYFSLHTIRFLSTVSFSETSPL